MTEPGRDDAILTKSDLRQWEAELQDIDRQIAELRQRRDELDQKIRYVHAVVQFIKGEPGTKPPPASLISKGPKLGQRAYGPGAKPDYRRRGGKPSWTSEVARILKEAGQAVGYDELKEQISKGPLAERLARSDKGLYGAVGKLESSGKLIKHKGWLFDPRAYRQFQERLARGEVEDIEYAPQSRHSPMAEATKRILAENPHGIRSRDLVAKLKMIPEFAEPIKKNSASAYNVFARLVKRGEIRKEGSIYYPLTENEPSGGGSDENAEGERPPPAFELQPSP